MHEKDVEEQEWIRGAPAVFQRISPPESPSISSISVFNAEPENLFLDTSPLPSNTNSPATKESGRVLQDDSEEAEGQTFVKEGEGRTPFAYRIRRVVKEAAGKFDLDVPPRHQKK